MASGTRSRPGRRDDGAAARPGPLGQGQAGVARRGERHRRLGRWRRSAPAGGVPIWLSIPVTIALALAVTQLLAVGMTSPLREMTAAARRMATGDHSVRVAATSRDEVGELARAFNRMAEELAGVDRQRRELVANVSHELRTPAGGPVRAAGEPRRRSRGSRSATLRAALDQGERMTALVTDLLDLSRVDAGKAPLNLRGVEVGPLLEAAVAELRVSGRDVTYAVRVSSARSRGAGRPGAAAPARRQPLGQRLTPQPARWHRDGTRRRLR